MSARKLLYLKANHVPAVALAEISSAGWEVYIESDLIRARELIKSHQILVGLAQIDVLKGQLDPNQIEHLFPAGSTIEWVALLAPVCARNNDIFKLIARRFFDYHTLPLDPQRLLTTLGHAYGVAQRLQILEEQEDLSFGTGKLVGKSPAMQKVFHNIQKLAWVDAPVLITGESGTGKEVAAQTIHELSRRSTGPFVPVNCGTMPTNLIQTELFGHEKGAFTGAIQRNVGCLESAAGGTVLLDEIGDLPLELQTNLLRFLQEKKIHRLGGFGEISVDVRIIAATHVNLEKAVQQGNFREDLYYRLNVLPIRMPPLREREGDIELLTNFFFEKFSRESGHDVKGFTEEALRFIKAYRWPGNVREMINSIRRAVVMCEKRLIRPRDLGLDRRSSKWRPNNLALTTLDEARSVAEKDVVLSTLHRTQNNISLAARELKVSRITLYRLIEKYGIGADPDLAP
jgi:DNA-binding NtrC family response regulator